MTKKYVTVLNTRPFLFRETKIIADLMAKGLSKEEIKKKVIEENIFQLSNTDRARRFYSEINKRLTQLDDFLLEKLVSTDSSTAKGILLYALLKRDQLFYEWMREVVFDKYLILAGKVLKKETLYFIESKSEQSETVRNWHPETKKKLISAYHHVLCEAGMARENKEELILYRILLDSSVKNYLIEQKEKAIVEVLIGAYV
ncbi:DUF1819 family protein [Pisciglobus halotolerans]|uniref:Putative inner membrane protein n=1 Tax=Pisciglobus halotolerans TaxID=745365 RepID=A0A1I3ASG6_9LACT|nr:DUF1819 family protein [Pisciglobus halotolerans]SFH52716.1 Putative inner membrane protein [Pisciglobus halotolerans]